MQKLAHHEIPRPSAQDLAGLPRHGIVLLLHDLRSAHNVGSIMRTADAMRVREVVVSGHTPDPSDRKVHKTALGAQDSVPWRRVEDLQAAFRAWKQDGYAVTALELTDQSRDIRSLRSEDFPLVLIAGNEVDGVPDSLLAHCDTAFEIPQYGMKQSLNVSVAVAIALYEAIRHLNPT